MSQPLIVDAEPSYLAAMALYLTTLLHDVTPRHDTWPKLFNVQDEERFYGTSLYEWERGGVTCWGRNPPASPLCPLWVNGEMTYVSFCPCAADCSQILTLYDAKTLRRLHCDHPSAAGGGGGGARNFF
jgi:hypothetical protein